MGSSDSKLNFRKAVIQLTTKTQVIYIAMQQKEGLQGRLAHHIHLREHLGVIIGY